jgi:hypothetical protein
MDARIKSGHDERILYKHTFAFPRRQAPELCMQLSPKKFEGAGNAGRLVRPQPRVVGSKHAR